MKQLILKPGKERSLLRRHPWIYDSAIAHIADSQGSYTKTSPESGETVRVLSHTGGFLALAAYSPSSKIRARVWSFDASSVVDADFFYRAISNAVRARDRMAISSTGLRLVHGEADNLPGLIVDRYNDILVAQFLSAGTQKWRDTIAEALLAVTGCDALYERSDSGVRQLEGLPLVRGWLRQGKGGEHDLSHVITEHEWQLQLHIEQGHKTGFYLDQRDSRKKLYEYAQRLHFASVLNCYCYTGGFSVAALMGGAQHVTSIDSSATAIEQARANLALNQIDPRRSTLLTADVNASLRRFYQEGRQFDAIVLDPPKFAPTAHHAPRAARAYKDINRLALKILQPGGILFTYSCSGGVDADLFHKIVAGAGLDASVDGYILERVGAAPDHPMTIQFPEGEYLKGLVLMRK